MFILEINLSRDKLVASIFHLTGVITPSRMTSVAESSSTLLPTSITTHTQWGAPHALWTTMNSWWLLSFQCMHEIHSPLLFRVVSLALGTLWLLPSADKGPWATWVRWGVTRPQQNTTKHKICDHSHFYLHIEAKTKWPPFSRRHFEMDFFNENAWISIKISLKFVLKGPINNIPALVQIMAWRQSGDKPLSEPMMVSLMMHICVTRPQWVNNTAVGMCVYIGD